MTDPLLPQAKEASIKQGFVSISNTQRMLRIGYTRAARLIDLLIEEGFCESSYEPDTYRRKIINSTEDVK
jgi:DNA segregation ATPase FtsK/SpoIIIE-like protein